MKKVFVVANQKGGIGKTTTSLALTTILNTWGHKTLLIDADPSGNATDTLKGKSEGEATLYDVILETDDPVKLGDAIQKTENGYIIASDKLLLKTDSICSTDPNGIYRLADAIDEAKNDGSLDDYEYIVIDTQPDVNTLLNNCLVAADEVIIPVTTDRYAVTGLFSLSEIINSIKKRPNKNLNIFGLLLVKYNARTKLSKATTEFLENAADNMGTVLLDTTIRESIGAREAQTFRKPLIEYAPHSTTEQDYEAFVDLILKESEA